MVTVLEICLVIIMLCCLKLWDLHLTFLYGPRHPGPDQQLLVEEGTRQVVRREVVTREETVSSPNLTSALSSRLVIRPSSNLDLYSNFPSSDMTFLQT